MSSLESDAELGLVLCTIDNVVIGQLIEETTSLENQVAVGIQDNCKFNLLIKLKRPKNS